MATSITTKLRIRSAAMAFAAKRFVSSLFRCIWLQKSLIEERARISLKINSGSRLGRRHLDRWMHWKIRAVSEERSLPSRGLIYWRRSLTGRKTCKNWQDNDSLRLCRSASRKTWSLTLKRSKQAGTVEATVFPSIHRLIHFSKRFFTFSLTQKCLQIYCT